MGLNTRRLYKYIIIYNYNNNNNSWSFELCFLDLCSGKINTFEGIFIGGSLDSTRNLFKKYKNNVQFLLKLT